MIKRIACVFLCLCAAVSFCACSKDDKETISTDKWNGTYMWVDEETEEFKVVEAIGIDEETVSFCLESSRITEEFEAHIKSASGRYLAENLGARTVKVTLSADLDTVAIDDMWTDDASTREENWSGKYKKVALGEQIPAFGDKLWNGIYTCEETGLTVSLYGIKEGFALFSYTKAEGEEELTYTYRLLEPEKGKAVYTEGERLIMVERISKSRIKVIDLYMQDSENKGISGIYKKQ